MSSQQSDLLSPDDQNYLFGHLDMNDINLFSEETSTLNNETGYIVEEDYKPIPTAIKNVLSNEEYPGLYDFEVNIHPNGTKNAWVYSAFLNKVYMDMRSPFPVDFRIKNRPPIELYIRTTPVYSSPQYAQEFVCRCINHEYLSEKADDNLMQHVRQHIIRCANSSAMYLGDKNQNERLSVVIPFSFPQTGTDSVREMFEFVCKNSCPMPGMNRRAIEVIFTLEDCEGNVLGRKTLNVRVCSCPKRDKEKDEKDNLNNVLPSRGKKRKMEKPEKKVIMTSENDYKEYPVTINIVGKHNVQQVLKYCHDLMAGEVLRHANSGTDMVYKKCLNDINALIREPIDP